MRFYGSQGTALPCICRQHAALHPTKSGHALEVLRFGNNDGQIDQENLLGGSIAFQASQVGVRSYHRTFPSGKRQQGDERSHDKTSETSSQPHGIPERSDLPDGNNASGSQAADMSQDSGQDSRTSKDSEEAPEHEATEARQEPSPEEERYAAEFQRVADEPCGLSS